MDAAENMGAALAGLVPAGVTWACSTQPADQPLLAAEAYQVRRMSARREADFRQGRQVAHEALRQLGLPELSLPVGFQGAPIWPAGVVGSISHTDGTAVAVAGRLEVASGLGIDLEIDGPLESGVVQMVCRPAELAQLQAAGIRDGHRLIFAAKESVYKCIWPRLRRFVEFGDVELYFDFQLELFRVTPATQSLDLGMLEAVQGRYARCHNRVLALAYLPSAASM